MKLYVFLIGLVCFSASSILAQKIGFRAGLSIPSLTQEEDNIFADGFESVANFEGGILVEIPLNNKWSIQPELTYTTRGGEKNGLQAIPPNDIPQELSAALPAGLIPFATFDNKSNPTYLEIPVLIKYGWGEKWRFYANIGPYIGFLISAEQTTGGTSQIFLDPQGTAPLVFETPLGPVPVTSSFESENDVKDDLEDINFGIQGGIGLIRRLNAKHEVFFDIRVSRGFIPIQRDDFLGSTTVGGVVFSLGYTYNLKNKAPKK